MKAMLCVFTGMLLLSRHLSAYEVGIIGGAGMDIPEAWILDDSDPAVPTWYSPDSRSVADIMIWPSETWESVEIFAEAIRPADARGETSVFPCWDGQALLADWVFTVNEDRRRGWFLYVSGTSGPDVRLSAVSAFDDFDAQQPFLLSVLDSYLPSDRWQLYPGAVSVFLEMTGEQGSVPVRQPFGNSDLTWNYAPGAALAAQDVIEREALVLSAYGNLPELFYPAWRRYYRFIYRDSYHRLDSLALALTTGPLPPGALSDGETAETLLRWLQGFSYGSTDGFSDLLAPSTACARSSGDCDSLSLTLLILLDAYGIDGRILVSQQARHALTALNLPYEGVRYWEEDRSWVVAELTSLLPLGVLPERLSGVDDWYSIPLPPES